MLLPFGLLPVTRCAKNSYFYKFQDFSKVANDTIKRFLNVGELGLPGRRENHN